MCLGVPLRIVEVKEGNIAIADMGGSTLEISTIFTPEVKVGDYVLVHAGFSISILSNEEAEEIISALGELER
ncbi:MULTISPECIES: HypC/HybG/HupF family hydrogenase formation chaperone [Dictyoglomus]|jgi:hydrogenase expression/formation protein HypC|uniref:Hydrogenase assembly chaperone hypC/hupF n=1 Tax=Dictyoglomus turgidum (strain DSM 6724 / Z-1310) TaxID=515635 RepID=B8DYP4_DICTD|nr:MULTISPECIES: HypC/HybG/HupF family hydrogenase formation chaperone [Dictyoglomus]ACK41426.1 hydrogenase assembly chaperone hypC/hupF [Dictyoglomus turgidum DSM 6724]PNV79562.1 MAG: HypC/HybG/HupF family hydrogenase formation chaperone [Dictyoglomus turgidum]HBU31569.1 HypC/HybG/HupF family hydrogenase formation chaperone [Dictyoglomus sp.]